MTCASMASSLECSICLNLFKLFSLRASSVFLVFFRRFGESLRLWTTPLESPAMMRGSEGLKEIWLRTPWLVLSIF